MELNITWEPELPSPSDCRMASLPRNLWLNLVCASIMSCGPDVVHAPNAALPTDSTVLEELPTITEAAAAATWTKRARPRATLLLYILRPSPQPLGGRAPRAC